MLETFSVSRQGVSLPAADRDAEAVFSAYPQDDDRRRREQVTGKVLMLDRSLEDARYIFALVGVDEAATALAQVDPQLRRRRTFEAITRLLLRESLNQPVLLLVEDLHWLDNETQAWLNLFSGSPPHASLLVNYRPEYQHGWGSKTYYTQLRLDPLGPQEAHALLTVLLGSDAALQPLAHLFWRKRRESLLHGGNGPDSGGSGVLRRAPAGGMQPAAPVTSRALAALLTAHGAGGAGRPHRPAPR